MENNPELISASVSDRGLSEKRPQNEDSFAELPSYGVFAVADGVGGAQAGDFASQMAMELLTEAVTNRSDSADAEDLFRMAIEHANRSIYQMAMDVPQLSSMATTIVALNLNGNIATLAHVGDSRIYRFTPDGRAFRETDDHSVVEEEVRAGRMTPEEAAVHPSRNVISRALGAESTVNIDVKTIMVEPGTTFLLCSDGITRHIPDEELQAIFASNAQPNLICDHLKELCYSRGAEDNLTAVVVRTFAQPVAEEHDFDSTVPVFDSTIPVMEEETVASSRSAYAAAAGETKDLSIEDTIAELDFLEIEEPKSPGVPEGQESAEPANQTSDEDDMRTADEVPQMVEPLVEPDTDEQYLLTESDAATDDIIAANTDDISDYTSSSVVVPAQETAAETDFGMFGSQSYADDHTPAGGGMGRIIISLAFLVLGAALAIGGSYMLGFTGKPSEPVQPPQVETMKSENVALTEFEESRRMVDQDPAGYLTKRTVTPTDAVDFYLIGRALLLTGKTLEAKKQFELALERLPQVEEPERRSLSNEIKLALAVANTPQAAESFNRSMAPASNSATGPIR